MRLYCEICKRHTREAASTEGIYYDLCCFRTWHGFSPFKTLADTVIDCYMVALERAKKEAVILWLPVEAHDLKVEYILTNGRPPHEPWRWQRLTRRYNSKHPPDNLWPNPTSDLLSLDEFLREVNR